MDDEKKYKEALSRAKGMWDRGMMPERIEYIFPEPKESEDEKDKENIVYISLGKITDKELYNKIVYKTTQCAEFMFQHDWWLYEQDGEPSINITTTVEFLKNHNLLKLLNHKVSRKHLQDCRSSYIPTSCRDLYFRLKEEKENI